MVVYIMARVTVEDCLEYTDGIFSLIKVAAKRARRLANGSESLIEDEQNDKPAVLALREIAEGHLDNPDFHRTENDLEKELAEELSKSEEEFAQRR
jgi:DNA-directed RNA polymerase subunit omega